MKENNRFRRQIAWMMFLFSILVIWVHSYNVELFAGRQLGPAWDRAAQVETFWSVGIGQIAVPGFFMLSSYLFFRNFKIKKLLSKWKSRFFSVAVPYVIWNLLYYLGYVTATRLPVVEQVVGKEPISLSVEGMVNAVLHYSYAPVFWYLFQLILLLLLAPVIYLLVKQKLIGLCYLAVLVVALKNGFDTGYSNADALFYFSAAVYAAVHEREWMERKGTKDRILAGFLVLIVAVYSYGMMKEPSASVLWTIAYRFLAPVSLWLMLSSVELPETKPWMRQSMFLYGIHFIIVRFVNKGAAMLLTKGIAVGRIPQEWMQGAAMGIYFAIPVIVLASSYAIALLLSKKMPPVWRLLSGGRTLSE